MLKRFYASLLVLLCVLNAQIFSQDVNSWYNKPIKSIEFEGLVNVKQADLDGVMSSFIGKEFTDETPNEIYDKIDSLDFFEEINIKVIKLGNAGKSLSVVIEVKEYPIVTRISFEGNAKLSDSELREAVSIKDKDIFNEDKLLIEERNLRNHYIDKGYSEAEVSSSTVVSEDGVKITFKIVEGKQVVVKKIAFEGNKVVSEKTLKGQLKLKELGLFSNGAFQDVSITADSKAIISYYQNRGYVDIKVLNVRQESSFNEEKNRQELTITFEIQEGSMYDFGGVTFVGNKVFTTEKLLSLVKLKSGDLYKETKWQESKAAIQNLYYENGYTSNQFYPQMIKDVETKTVSYIMNILENPRSHIEKIIIKGNSKTKDFVIRREIPIDSGDIFSNAKIMNAMRNLYNLQYFSSVVPDVQPGSEENLVELVFTVEEQSTTTLDFGFTFSGVTDPDDFPIALYFKLQNSNLFGEGRSLSAGTTLSTDEQSVNLAYSQNWLFNMPISSSVSLNYSHSTSYSLLNHMLPDGSIDADYFYMEYEQHEFNLSASLGRRWTPNFAILSLAGGISGSLINNIYDPSIYIPNDSSVSQYNNNWEPKNSIWSSFSMDGRDINYDPSKGWFFSERLAWFGLMPEGMLGFAPQWGEKEFYLKTDSKAEIYFTLLNKPVSESYTLKLVLMAYSSLSMQFPCFDSSIKQANQLYIDGMFNGRGWSIYNTDKGRGQVMWSNILELRMPVVPGIVSVDLWFDAICIKDTAKEFFTSMTSEDWYYSFGPSIRFTIQQFPLRLLFVNTFQVKDGELVWENRDATGNNKWYKNFEFVLSFNLTNR